MPIFIATENADVCKIHEQSESLVKNGILVCFWESPHEISSHYKREKSKFLYRSLADSTSSHNQSWCPPELIDTVGALRNNLLLWNFLRTDNIILFLEFI